MTIMMEDGSATTLAAEKRPLPRSEPAICDPDAAVEEPVPEGFDEAAYLAAFPDVAAALRSSPRLKTALDHYRLHGQREARLTHARYQRALALGKLADRKPAASDAAFPASHIDNVFVCPGGLCLVSGWIDDSEELPLQQIILHTEAEIEGFCTDVTRFRRKDVEGVLPGTVPKLLGFWTILHLKRPFDSYGTLQVSVITKANHKSFAAQPVVISDERLRDVALMYIADAQYFVGDPSAEALLHLHEDAAKSLIALNAGISEEIARGAWQTRFGVRRQSYDGSIVVCLYGKAEFLTLQAALFSCCPGFDRYEYIYVSNSPELGDKLLKEAMIASRVYGVAITLILLPGNAGFGAANNVAVNAAQSDRILLVNPDVLPRDLDWPERHGEVIQNLPSDQATLFGVPLYYDDGSLMHGGMYFEVDGGFRIDRGKMLRRDIIRVEHYGKGAPAETETYLASRPVPAVTGAFISIDRRWFEFIGGFSPEYVFGHYEDVDLCLKSLQAGMPAWIHNVPFWHLESKGSTRRPVHDGGRLINRWHMTTKWGALVKAELNGKHPARFAT